MSISYRPDYRAHRHQDAQGRLICWLASCLSSLLCLACTAGPGKNRGKAGGRPPSSPPAVTALTVDAKNVATEIRVVITLLGREQSYVYSRVPGRVVSIERTEGQPVSAQSLLFRVERTEPGESFLAVPVASPISGWVGRILVVKGQQIMPVDPLAVVVDDAALRGVISLPQALHDRVRMNTPVFIETQQGLRPAKIVSVARAGDGESGRGSFTVETDNQDHSLSAGSVVTALIRLGERPRLMVPTEALRITEQGTYVFAIDNNTAVRKPVTFELLSANQAEVTSGLSNGTLIALKGTNLLTEGTAVRVVERDGQPVTDSSKANNQTPAASQKP